jgi:N-acyl-D-aspartate/D-glutamate deacylase
MPKPLTPILVAVLAGFTLASCGPSYDVIVRNGDVIDGTGAAPRRADIAIKGDRIVSIGTVEGSAREQIDATGRVVAPGFIDVQGQSGVTLLADGNGESHIRQGITSEVVGEGGTPALWTNETADEQSIKRFGITYDWTGAHAGRALYGPGYKRTT